MAFKMQRKRTKTTPYVLIDEESGYMKFSGESYLENVMAFFADINDWLTDYLARPSAPLTFECEMDYFNSSTKKLLYKMFLMMDDASQGPRKVIVNWLVADNDEIITECGEDFKGGMLNLEFNIVRKAKSL